MLYNCIGWFVYCGYVLILFDIVRPASTAAVFDAWHEKSSRNDVSFKRREDGMTVSTNETIYMRVMCAN